MIQDVTQMPRRIGTGYNRATSYKKYSLNI